MTTPPFSAAEQVGPATRLAQLPGSFTTRSGASLHGVRIAYETWGKLSAGKDNVLLILTGLSPSAHAASSAADPAPGWWEDIVGPGKPIDSDRFFVVCVNSLGSCKGSTGPASPDPATGQAYRLDFPVLHLEDVARAARDTLQLLGVERLHAIVGPSMGGMSALAYAMMFPEAVKHLSLISTACQATPLTIALRSLQRELIRSDPAWRNGEYALDEEPVKGMQLARKLGMITYRSGEEWLQRFNRDRVPAARRTGEPFGMQFEVESYLQAHAERFVGSFDANCYLYLSRAMDLFEVASHGGSVQAGLETINAESVQVIGVESDALFPLWQQRELADGLRAAGVEVCFTALPSIQGHDSFLVDTGRFGREIQAFLQRTIQNEAN